MEIMLNQNIRPYRLSVVMIVKNEAKNLKKSLPALKGWIDELIVLDSGSTDESQKIVEQAGGKWFVNTEWEGFGKQRQLAQKYATGDWILALDADEEITSDLRDSILEKIRIEPSSIIYGIKRVDCIFGHKIDNPYWPLKAYWRLFPKKYQFNSDLVHESLNIKDSSTVTLQGVILHHTAETPIFWLKKRLDYAEIWALDRNKKGKKISFLSIILRTFWSFFRQYLIEGRFLMGKYGLVYSLLFMHYTFNKYFILYQMNGK